MTFYSIASDVWTFLITEISSFALMHNINHNMSSIIHGSIIILRFEFPVHGNFISKCTLNTYYRLIPNPAQNNYGWTP